MESYISQSFWLRTLTVHDNPQSRIVSAGSSRVIAYLVGEMITRRAPIAFLVIHMIESNIELIDEAVLIQKGSFGSRILSASI